MSRHFELLQRLARESEIFEIDPATTATQPVDGAAPPDELSVHHEIERPAVDPGRHQEVAQLTQRLFFAGSTGVPITSATFCPVSGERSSSLLSALTAELLDLQTERSVCLVDTDAERGSLHDAFGISRDLGVTNSLMSDQPIGCFAARVRGRNLTVVPAGPPIPGWEAMVVSQKFARRLHELRPRFQYLLVNAPAPSHAVLGSFLGRLTDGVVLILEANSTRRDVAARLTAHLQQAQVPVLGAVLNNRTFPIPASLYSRLF